MFPAYQGAPLLKASSETEYETVQGTLEDSEDDDDNFDKLDPEDLEARQRWFFSQLFPFNIALLYLYSNGVFAL